MRSAQSNRFNLTNTTRHQHTQNDVAPINQNDITPGNTVVGSAITFAQKVVYKIGVNFNPTSVLIHGNVTGASGEKFFIVGNAQFGPSLYLQPNTTNSVITGGSRQTIVQAASYFGYDGTSFHTLVSDGPNIVDVAYPANTIHARAQIIGYNNKNLLFQVTDLDAGWAINASFTIT